MKPVRLAILDMNNDAPNQGMRCIKQIVTSFGRELSWDVYNVRGANEVPDLSYDIYISTGGPGSPFDGDGVWDTNYYNWIDNVRDWNQQTGVVKKHVLFICHSFQMAVEHFGLAKVNRRHSTSFGTFACHQTDQGISDPLLAGLPNPFYVADFRDWQVVEPDMKKFDAMGARILSLEKVRPHVPRERAIMAIRFSDSIVGTQFHPEADAEGMTQHFLDPERRKKIIAEHSERKYERMMNHLSDPDKIGLTNQVVIPGFVERAMRSVRQPAAATI